MQKKFIKKPVMAAEEDDTRLEDLIDSLEDDFDYAISGLHMLDRSGSGNREAGIAIANDLNEKLQSIIANIGKTVGRGED